MNGLDIEEMPVDKTLSITYSLIVDESYNLFEETRADGRQRVDAWLAEYAAAAAHKPPPSADPETWGLLPEHQSGLSLALQMAGDVTTGGPSE